MTESTMKHIQDLAESMKPGETRDLELTLELRKQVPHPDDVEILDQDEDPLYATLDKFFQQEL